MLLSASDQGTTRFSRWRWYRELRAAWCSIISSVPGFVEYVGVQVGEDVALTISLFSIARTGREESTRRAARVDQTEHGTVCCWPTRDRGGWRGAVPQGQGTCRGQIKSSLLAQHLCRVSVNSHCLSQL